jgi:hypothetical protein
MTTEEITEKLKKDHDLCYLAYRGSIAHNLYVPPEEENGTDDVDLIGFVYGEERDYLGLGEWGSRGTKEIKIDQYDIVLYEVTKAVKMLAAANPNILSSLWVIPEHVLYSDKFGDELRKNRVLFLSKDMYHSFSGYAHGMVLKSEAFNEVDLRQYVDATDEAKRRGIHPNHKGIKIDKGNTALSCVLSNEDLLHIIKSIDGKKSCNIGYMGERRKRLVLKYGADFKNLSCAIRLMNMCNETLLAGGLKVYRTYDRDYLLDIKNGKRSLEDVKAIARVQFDSAKLLVKTSDLPDKPDMEKIEALLMWGVRTHVLGRYFAR